MESKEDQLLGSVIVNHLFLSQFELFRACLLTLSARSPGVARDILQTVIRKIWTLKGVVWSESVPSSAHMAWLCLQELHAMEEKLMDVGAAKPEGDPWDAAASTSDPPGARLKHNHWQFYCRPVYNCIEFLLLLEFVKQFVVAKDNSGSPVSEEEGASSSDTTGDVVDERSGLDLVGRIASVGLERLDRSIRFVTGHGSEGGGDRDDRRREDEDVGRAETSGSSVEQLFSEVEKKWLRRLTLGQPELLDALCQNIARQQHGGSNLHVDSQREVDPDRGDEGPQEVAAVLGSLEHFELGSGIEREVQEAHLNQIMEDVKEAQLLKAINHLRFLHEDFGIAESDCSGAIHSILKEAKSLVREQHDSVLQAIYECSLTSSSTLLPS